MKTKKILLIGALTVLTFPGVFGAPENEKSIFEKSIFAKPAGKTGLSAGKFQTIDVVNKLKDSTIDLVLNENKEREKYNLTLHEEKGYIAIPVQGGVLISSVHLIVTNPKTNTQIDSGNIELDWVNSNAAKRLVIELKKKGIKATVNKKAGTLDITINEVSNEQ